MEFLAGLLVCWVLAVPVACLIAGMRASRRADRLGHELDLIRLALNPAVLDYHPRSLTRLWNWFLYSYGIVTVCLFATARLLAPPRDEVGGRSVRPLLWTLVTILKLFLHDLTRLSALYRIGAFLGVAVISILASVLYQRFFAAESSDFGRRSTNC